MKDDGLSDCSIKFVSKALTMLSKHCDLNNPESVKPFIANINGSVGYKKNLSRSYNKFCKYYGIQWTMPKYIQQSKPIKIPTNEKLEMMISSSGYVLSIELMMSKECGLRPIEVCNLRVKDVDLEQKLLYVNTAKGGPSRTLARALIHFQKCTILTNTLSK